MSSISILIKPASSTCNINCKYCFYKDVAKNREVYSNGFMSDLTIKTIVQKAFVKGINQVNFSFQGGEPTLVGLDYYKNFMSYIEKYNIYNAQTNLAIQTNGYTLNDEWCEFLKKYNFLVGISLDGPKDIHDELRTIGDYKGTYTQVMKSIDLLKKYDVPFNILCVLTAFNSKHIAKVYKFFKKQNFTHLQFIPCLDPLDGDKCNSKFSLKTKDYEYALNKLFEFYRDDFFNNEYTSIRVFDNYIQMLLGYPPENCGIAGICSCYFVLEANGDIYPCDFYCIDKHLLGNIHTVNFEDLYNSPTALNFIDDSKQLSPECKECKYFPICRGGCKRYRTDYNNENILKNHFCKAYYNFFDKNLDQLTNIAINVSNK